MCLETRWLGQKPWFLLPGTTLYSRTFQLRYPLSFVIKPLSLKTFIMLSRRKSDFLYSAKAATWIYNPNRRKKTQENELLFSIFQVILEIQCEVRDPDDKTRLLLSLVLFPKVCGAALWIFVACAAARGFSPAAAARRSKFGIFVGGFVLPCRFWVVVGVFFLVSFPKSAKRI